LSLAVGLPEQFVLKPGRQLIWTHLTALQFGRWICSSVNHLEFIASFMIFANSDLQVTKKNLNTRLKKIK
jgi:hypothetical protein